MWPTASSVWLQAADLPFAFCAILYGGLSLYVSLRDPAKPSPVLQWGIALPLAALFLVLAVLNFWGAWPFNA
jgi:amino acid transporter